MLIIYDKYDCCEVMCPQSFQIERSYLTEISPQTTETVFERSENFKIMYKG